MATETPSTTPETPTPPDMSAAPDRPGLDSPLSTLTGGPGLVYSRLLELKRRATPLPKDQKMQVKGQVRYMYRGIDDIYDHLHTLMGEIGILLVPSEVREVKRASYETPPKFDGGPPGRANHVALIQRFHWVAEDGSTMPVDLPGEGLDSGDKGTGKAASMAHKYAFVQSLSLPLSDPDPEGEAIEGAPAPSPDRDQSPVSGNNSTPGAPVTEGTRVPFRNLSDGRAAIQAMTAPDEQPVLRRRVFDSVNSGQISGADANTLMGLLDDQVRGQRT